MLRECVLLSAGKGGALSARIDAKTSNQIKRGKKKKQGRGGFPGGGRSKPARQRKNLNNKHLSVCAREEGRACAQRQQEEKPGDLDSISSCSGDFRRDLGTSLRGQICPLSNARGDKGSLVPTERSAGLDTAFPCSCFLHLALAPPRERSRPSGTTTQNSEGSG